jgi:hypothetical protein
MLHTLLSERHMHGSETNAFMLKSNKLAFANSGMETTPPTFLTLCLDCTTKHTFMPVGATRLLYELFRSFLPIRVVGADDWMVSDCSPARSAGAGPLGYVFPWSWEIGVVVVGPRLRACILLLHSVCSLIVGLPPTSDDLVLFSWLGALAVMPVYLTEHSVKERIVFFKTLLLGEFPIDGWCLLPPQRESCPPRRSESPRSRPTHLLQRLSMFVCLASKSMPARRRKSWKSICDRQLHIAHYTALAFPIYARRQRWYSVRC